MDAVPTWTHAARVESLDRTDTGAVVPEFRVVVVLDDEAPGTRRRPGDQLGASGRSHDGAGRELVGGRDDDR